MLITGKNGQVGRCLVELLTSTGVELLACGREELDITSQQEVEGIITAYRPDYVVNAAAYTAVDKAESEPELAYQVNRDGPRNLALAARKYQSTLLHISTDYVYSDEGEQALTEAATTGPKNRYGKSKLAGELAIAGNCTQYFIIRTSWVFSDYGNNFVKTMLGLGQTEKTLGVIDDQVGGPTYAGDIASVIINIITDDLNRKDSAPKYGIYNYCGQPFVSWYGFAREIFKAAAESDLRNCIPRSLHKITTSEYSTPAERPHNSRLDTTKILKMFGVKPGDWKPAIKETVKLLHLKKSALK